MTARPVAAGKLPAALLGRLLASLPAAPPEVLLGPELGEDACAIEIPAVHAWELPFDLDSMYAWLFDCPLVPSATMLRRVPFREIFLRLAAGRVFVLLGQVLDLRAVPMRAE